MSPVTLSQTFAAALHHHQAGRLAHAEAIYWQILSVTPDHSGALHFLGVLAHQAGRNDRAVDLIQKALALEPRNAAAHSNLSAAYHALGRYDDAIASLRRAIELQPSHAESWHNLGVNLGDTGRVDEAIVAYRQAVACKPDYSDAYNNLGIALAKKGQLDDAVAAYLRALQAQPAHVGAMTNLGNALKDQGHFEEAIATYQRALDIEPSFPQAWTNLGIALALHGRLDEAVAAHSRALALDPHYLVAHNNLSIALRERGDLDDAMVECRRALDLQPACAAAHNNLGNALRELGRYAEAEANYRRALEIEPDLGEAQFNYAVLLLLRGDYERAWPLYESRRHEVGHVPRQFPQPAWTGEPLAGRRVLIHAEQGFGDAIQFVRYAGLIAESGGEVIVECPRPLAKLFRTATGVHQVVATGDPLPPFDLHVAMLSQPLGFRTTRDTIPAAVPYLSADPARSVIWRHRLGPRHSRPRVGLAWAGNSKTVLLRRRHLTPIDLYPLLTISGVDFYSLQVGHDLARFRDLEGAAPVIDLTAEIADFADTAALITELDLVISVDTAVAHLAGALGRPIWTLLPFVPDWRWGLETTTSPWYPSMRLYRQTTAGDWSTVVSRAATELREQFDTSEPAPSQFT